MVSYVATYINCTIYTVLLPFKICHLLNITAFNCLPRLIVYALFSDAHLECSACALVAYKLTRSPRPTYSCQYAIISTRFV